MTDRFQEDPVDAAADLSVDLLADLDADLLEPSAAARVRVAAAGDARASAVLAGLAATRAELAALPAPPVPEPFAARWDAALTAAGAPPGAPPASAAPDPPTDSAPPSARPVVPGRFLHRSGVRAALAAVALAAAVVAGVLLAPREPEPLSLDRVDLADAGLAVQGDLDVGELAHPARLRGCLRTVAPPGVPPDASLVGGRDVVLDGQRAVLLVLAAGPPRPGVHVVVVDPGCGPAGGRLLAAQTVTG